MKNIKNQLVGLDPRFTYRGLNQTRIETFSDAVFAFSVTLVVLSSSVPESFTQLRESFREIIPFLVCVVLIVLIWYQHYIFFIRYGLQDKKTVVINAFLLFVLLVYVYPLKFLMTLLFEMYYGFFSGDMSIYTSQYGKDMDMAVLMTAYGFGCSIIFLALAGLYRHAYKRRTDLELSEYEVYATRVSVKINVLMSTIPFLSAMISVVQPFGQGKAINFIIAGFWYMLYPPVMITYGRIVSAKMKKLFG